MLVGQVCDGIATPLVGFYSDKMTTRIGKRMPWYILGTCIVPTCFFFIWQDCYICHDGSETALQIVWYSFFAGAFNIGWAMVQISHMSLTNSLTPVKERRDLMIGLRTGFTYVANVTVLLLAFIMFKTISDPKTQFSVLSILTIAVGLFLNVLFILVIKEVKLSSMANQRFQEDLNLRSPDSLNTLGSRGSMFEHIKWNQWLTMPAMYPVGLVYMMARLGNNVASSMMPFYLTTVLAFGGVSSPEAATKRTPWELALIPLLQYVGSVATSWVLDRFGRKYPRKFIYIFGSIVTVCGSLPLFVRRIQFITRSMKYSMIAFAFLLGVGFSVQLVTAMAFIVSTMQADFIGPYGASGAFVYGSISLMDKLCSGVVLFIIMVRRIQNVGNLDNTLYIRFTVGGLAFAASVASGLICLLIAGSKRGNDTFVLKEEMNENYARQEGGELVAEETLE